MAFEMFTGRVPFHDTDAPMAILLRHVNDPLPPVRAIDPSIDQEISDWIEGLVSKDPAARPGSAAAAWDAYEEIAERLLPRRWHREARLSGGPGAAPPVGTPPPFTPPPADLPSEPMAEPAPPADLPSEPLAEPAPPAEPPPPATARRAAAARGAAATLEPPPPAEPPDLPTTQLPAEAAPAPVGADRRRCRRARRDRRRVGTGARRWR